MKSLVLVVIASLLLGSTYAQRIVEHFKPIAVYTPSIATSATDASGKIYLGGNFQYFNGVITGGLVRVSSDGNRDDSFNVPPLTTCSKIYPQPDGKLYFVGAWPMPDGTYLEFVRLNSDGTRDPSFAPPVAPGPNGIRDIGVQSTGKIVVVGNYNYGGGSYTTSRLLTNGQPDTSFPVIPVFGNLFGGALAIASDDSFYLSDGLKVYKCNPEGILDNNYSTGAGIESNHWIDGFGMLKDGRIIIKGSLLSKYNDVVVHDIARLTTSGQVDPTFIFSDIEVGQTSPILETSSGNLIVAGSIPSEGFSAGFVELKSNGTVERRVLTSGGGITTLAEVNDKIYVAGAFSSIAGTENSHMAQLNSDGSVNTSFKPQIIAAGTESHHITAVGQGKVIVAGSSEYKAVLNNGILTAKKTSRLTTTGADDNTFALPTVGTGEVRAVFVQDDGKYLIGGAFFGPLFSTPLIRVNSSGSQDESFVSHFDTSPRDVRTIKVRNGKMYVSGQFSTYSGQPSGGLIVINSDGSLAQAYPGLPGGTFIYDFEVLSNGKVMILSSAPGGAGIRTVRRLNVDGSVDTSLPTISITGFVVSLACDADDRVYVGGSFTVIGGVSKTRMARLLADGSVDATFNAGSDFSAGATIRRMHVLPDGNLAVGGIFSSYQGTEVHGFTILTPDGTRVPTPNATYGRGSQVSAMSYSDEVLHVAGKLWGSNGTELYGYGKISFATIPPPAAPDGLQVTLLEEGVFNLAWNDKSNNEVVFILERSTSETSGFTVREPLAANTTSMKDSLILENTTYYYRIAASGDGGQSAYSNVASLKWVPAPPTAPDQLAAVQTKPNEINVTWGDKSSNEKKFALERSIDNGTTFSKLINIEANTMQFTDTPEPPHEKYVYRIKAVGKYLSSAYSPNATVSVILGIDEEPGFALYPLPAAGTLYASTTADGQWQLITTTGQSTLLEAERASDHTKLDLNRIVPGMYFIRFISIDRVLVRRIIVTK